jgi:hypothetical protein
MTARPLQLALALHTEPTPDKRTSPVLVVPPATDAALCSECGVNPRAAGGRLTRCMRCVQAVAEQARQARAAAEARTTAKTSAVEAKVPPAPAKSKRKPKARVVDETAKREHVGADVSTACTSPGTPDPAKCCRTCGETKAVEQFARHAHSRDKRRHDCRQCVSEGKTKPPRELSPEQAARDKVQRAKPHRRRANRVAVRDWTRRNQAAARARAKLRKAVRKGVVKSAAQCEAVGCTASHRLEGHHHDYRAPLDVCWLCSRHHRRLHNGARIKLKPPTPQRFADIPDELNHEPQVRTHTAAEVQLSA